MNCAKCGGPAELREIHEIGDEEVTLLMCKREGCRKIEVFDDPDFEIAETPDERAQREEVDDDVAGAMGALHDQIDDLEDLLSKAATALRLMVGKHASAAQREGVDSVCGVCNLPALERCPKDRRLCAGYREANRQHEDFAEVRSALEGIEEWEKRHDG